MGLEWRDRDLHPLIQRQRFDETGELSLVLGAIQANDPHSASGYGPLPHSQQMSVVRQFGCRSGLCVLTVLDHSLRGSVRHGDLELD